MKTTKILAAVTALMIVGGVSTVYPRPYSGLTLTATAESGYTGGTYELLAYANYGDHIEILGCDYSAVNVDIPAKIDGLPVTVIGEYAFYHFPEEYDPYENSLVSVKIPDSVTIIGTGAFANCSKLSSIIIPDSVTVIEKSAFAGCYGLTEINIPENLTSISEMVFFGCTGLTEITIPKNVKYIGDSAFFGCEDLSSVTIPDSVTSIGDSAFWHCSSLTSVTVPKSVASIGNGAFGNCKGLTEVTILDPNCSITGLSTISNFAHFTDEATYGDFYGTVRGYEGSTTQAYAEKYYYNFESLGEAPPDDAILGDVNGDGLVDSVDAAAVLVYNASLAGDDDPTLDSGQLAVADVNGDGLVDSVDASLILVYNAYVADGGSGSISDFIKNM